MKWFAEKLLGKAMWFSVCVMVLALIDGQAIGQCELDKLLASDGVAGNFFGWSVSIGDTPGNEVAIVGVIRDEDNGLESGSAFIYRFNGLNWVEEAKLLASDGAVQDRFGQSVSISGAPGNEVAIVGAYVNESAYVFRFNGVNWVEEQKLVASDSTGSEFFGWSVSISSTPGNEVAIVGAIHDGDLGFFASGSAYIYRFDGVSWVEDQKLLDSDGAWADSLGWSVSISGTLGNEVAIVGALNGDGLVADSGSAYIYRFNGVSWVEEQKLFASDGTVSDNFGQSVSICGTPGNEVAVVGADNDDDNGLESGSACIYRRSGASWDQEAKLLVFDGEPSKNFGQSVSISGTPGNEVAVVGNFNSAYIYRYNGVSWIDDQKLLASDGAVSDRFGDSVSISGASGNEVVIVGAYWDDDNGSNSGSAYIFELSVCLADSNCSGEVNVTDLLLLLGVWGPCPAPCTADTNDDGDVNVTDLLDLLAAWGACP